MEFGFFGHWKRFGIFKAVATLDTYQITNCSDSKKKISFYQIFKEFEKEFSNQQFLDKNIILSKTWSGSKLCPSKFHGFHLKVLKQKDKKVFRMDLFLTMITNSFVNLIQNIFHSFLFLFFSWFRKLYLFIINFFQMFSNLSKMKNAIFNACNTSLFISCKFSF